MCIIAKKTRKNTRKRKKITVCTNVGIYNLGAKLIVFGFFHIESVLQSNLF